MGIKGRFLSNGIRRFEKDNIAILVSPLANDRWLVQAYAKHFHQEVFNFKSNAFQWVEAFFEFA